MHPTPTLLPHLAFYEALAALDESDPSWPGTVAGLLTLRLFDTWCEMGRRGERVQAWEISGVAEAVNQLAEGDPARASLGAIVAAVRAGGVAPAAVLPQLSAYARTLRYEARWLLAADVFSTILTNAHGATEEFVITAAYHRGYCLRAAGQLDAAAASYDEGRLLAASCGNEAGLLEADVSHAALAMHRGNFPAARALLDRVIERADPATCGRVLARAYHERAALEARSGRPEEAVVYGYKALPLYESPPDRDRVLGDICSALGDAGQHEAAWDGHLLLAVTALEQEMRWVATVNLIQLAALRDNERLFDRFREQLASVQLPAWLTGYYHLSVGAGYHHFGHPGLAARELRCAIDVATRFELNQIRIEAEDMLHSLGSAPARPAERAAARPEVAQVAAAVTRMRELAGVSVE